MTQPHRGIDPLPGAVSGEEVPPPVGSVWAQVDAPQAEALPGGDAASATGDASAADIAPIAGTAPPAGAPPIAGTEAEMAGLPGTPGDAAGFTSPPAPAQRRPGRLRRRIAAGTLLLIGAGGVGGGGFLLSRELGRHATSAEVAAASRQEVASRWQRLPAGQIFPATVSYADAEGLPSKAALVGIAPAVACDKATDPAAARELRAHGCVTVLRATYADASHTLAVTVGVAVMPSAAAAAAAFRPLGGLPDAGVLAASFPRTVSSGFTSGQRIQFGKAYTSGPYIFFFAGGYPDGRVSSPQGNFGEILTMGSGVLEHLEHVLTDHNDPCARKDIRC